MIENHKLPENCTSCYGCDEDICNSLAFGQYVVLWDRGIVGGVGEVCPECEVCVNSHEDLL